MMTMCSIITVSNSICNNNKPVIIVYFSSYTAGPTVEPTMRVSILSSRDTDPNVVFTLSFNVTFGLPSHVLCYHNNHPAAFFNSRDDPNLSREVIRSQYVDSSQPDMTHVTITVNQPREERAYLCEATVEGRVYIDGNNINKYKYDTKGAGTSNVMVTGE